MTVEKLNDAWNYTNWTKSIVNFCFTKVNKPEHGPKSFENNDKRGNIENDSLNEYGVYTESA